jgi:hypothetical protein
VLFRSKKNQIHVKRKSYHRIQIAGFILLMLLGLAFRLVFIENPLESDDSTYMRLADTLSFYNFNNPTTQLCFRTGVILPLALLIRIFGYSIFAYYLFSVGFSLLLLYAILLFTKELFGIKTTFLTGILFSSSYLIGYQSTNVLPDIPALFWATLSLLFSFRYLKYGNIKKYLLPAVLTAFLAYLCKEPILAIFAALPVYELFKRKSLRYSILFATGILLFWVMESTVYLLITGNFLKRVDTFAFGVVNWIPNQPHLTLGKFLSTPIVNILKTTNGIILFCLGMTGLILAIIKKNIKIIALFTGGFVVFVMYSYSFYSLRPLIPTLPPSLRYIAGFFTMLAIISSWTLISGSRYLKKFTPRYNKLALGLVVLSIFIIQSVGYSSNKNTVLFNNNTYIKANRLIKDKIQWPLQDSVYAFQRKDFSMYSNFRKLNLVNLKSLPATPCYILISEKKVKTKLHYAKIRKDQANIDLYERILNRTDSIKILESHGIVFSYVKNFGPAKKQSQ